MKNTSVKAMKNNLPLSYYSPLWAHQLSTLCYKIVTPLGSTKAQSYKLMVKLPGWYTFWAPVSVFYNFPILIFYHTIISHCCKYVCLLTFYLLTCGQSVNQKSMQHRTMRKVKSDKLKEARKSSPFSVTCISFSAKTLSLWFWSVFQELLS